MSVDSASDLLEDLHEQLETVPTLVELVQEVPVDGVLDDRTSSQFEPRTYDAGPIVRALLCRELAGLSWNGLYEFLSTDDRAPRLGFTPGKFGPYNTAPTRQTLATAWDRGLSDEELFFDLS